MGLYRVWKNYRVLIVMGTGLALVHWGWFKIKSNPIFHKNSDDASIPEPGIVTYVTSQDPPQREK